MSVQLKIVAGNPSAIRGTQLSSRDLHWLADSLVNLVEAGCPHIAHALASRANLNPLSISVLATWMNRAGLSERQILQIVV